MTGEKFVELCFKEKESMLSEYFSSESSQVSALINGLTENGANRDSLYYLIDSVMSETFYRLLLALDGEASLCGEQICYKLYDEDNNLLNECGEIEEAAYAFFMEE